MNLPLQNIHNTGRKIYLFLRNVDGSLSIKSDNSFYPYYFESTTNIKTKYWAYDGTPLRMIPCSRPSEISQQRSENNYSSDIRYTKRYVIDKITFIEKSLTKYAFIDIECLANEDEFPIPEKNPVSCITIYNSYSKEYNTWFMGDFKGSIKAKETKLLNFFLDYLKKEKFDVLLGWNMVDFDYAYLYNRIKFRYNKDFAKIISPINGCRYGNGELLFPAGLSIVDYLGLYRKVPPRRGSYALEDVMEDELGYSKEYKDVNFAEINEEIKLRNIEDVKGMIAIEEKRQLIPYYDEIRRFSKANWEDLPMKVIYSKGKLQKISNNSKIMDLLVLEEAKQMNKVLPNKDYNKPKLKYRGAERNVEQTGRFKEISQIDFTSAYPKAIVELCLDPNNIIEEPEEYKGNLPLIRIEDVYFKQDSNALLPRVAKKLLQKKEETKDLKNKTSKDDKNYNNIKHLYEAYKSLVNSLYGVFALVIFRMYRLEVASATTYIVREALLYTVNKLKELGYKVISYDTDAIQYEGKEDLSNLCNNLIKEWSKKEFGKEISLEYDYEGYYKTLFVKALTHYVGYLQTNKGIEKKVKGIESKKINSTEFIKKFQTELVDKILEVKDNKWKYEKEDIIEWIKDEIENFRNHPLELIAFPCKLNSKIEDYKNKPIWVRAYQNTQEIIPNFKKVLGQRYWYVYVIPEKQEIITDIYFDKEKIKSINKNILRKDILNNLEVYLDGTQLEYLRQNKETKIRVLHKKPTSKNVLAFDLNNKQHINNIDWHTMIEKNILLKVQSIFDALDWDYKELLKV